MRIMQYLWSSLLHSEIKKIIPSGLRLGAPAYFLAAAILMLLLSTRSTFAGSATWRLDPSDPFCNSCWEPGKFQNWTPETVPNGPADTATFDVSNVTGIGVDGNDIEGNGIVFNAGASAFTIDVTSSGSFPLALTISGVGITNNSGITQNFIVCSNCRFGGLDTALRFTNNATAGDLTVFTAFGHIDPSVQGKVPFRSKAIPLPTERT